MAISLAALLGVPSLKLTKAGLAETTWHQDILWVAVTDRRIRSASSTAAN